MKSMNLLLNEAKRNWRTEIRRDFPLRGDTSVVKRNSQNERDWLFSTELKRIYADISNYASLQKKIQNVVTKYRDGQQRSYVVVADGELVIDGKTSRKARKIKEIANDLNNNIVLFELSVGLEVLLSK